MGQQEVYDFLMKHPDEWFTSKQISEELIVSIGSVTMSLKKLRKTNIIKYRNTGKRNTFQYMVQSEPVKLSDRKPSLIEHADMSSGDIVSASISAKPKTKIKPKIVHQHTYLGGQTFYGVIRPKEEVDAIERDKRGVQDKRITRNARVLKRSSTRAATKKRTVHTTSQRSKKTATTKKKPATRKAATKKRTTKKR